MILVYYILSFFFPGILYLTWEREAIGAWTILHVYINPKRDYIDSLMYRPMYSLYSLLHRPMYSLYSLLYKPMCLFVVHLSELVYY